MRIRVAAVFVALLCGVSGAEAGLFGLFGAGHGLPRPIDDPVNMAKLPSFAHKIGFNTVHHSGKKYQDPTWGSERGKIFKMKDMHINHSLHF